MLILLILVVGIVAYTVDWTFVKQWIKEKLGK